MHPEDRTSSAGSVPVSLRTSTAMPLVIVIGHEGPFLPGSEGLELLRLGVPEIAWLARHFGHPGAEDFAVATPDAATVERLEALVAARRGKHRYQGLAPVDPISAPPPAEDIGELRMATPTAVAVSTLGFDFLHHSGDLRLRLDVRGLVALCAFRSPTQLADARTQQATALGAEALDAEQVAALVGRAIAVRLVVPLATDSAHAREGRALREFRRAVALEMQRTAEVARRLELHVAAEAAREAETGRRRIRVVPVNSEGNPLLSLGMLMTNAQAHRDGALNEHYQFLPDWADQTVPKLGPDDPPGIFLFSNYIWSHAWNVVRSAEVKERNPESLTVHGGPNTPKYDDDIQAFFAMNPQVDVTVHGEGEATLAHLLDVLKESMAAGKADRSLLADVPGLSYRDGDRVVHTGSRDRIQDLNSIPSPYESGLFDSVGDVEITLMTIETNRGCPYGCTYCDWGSATLSRIRRFDLDRVYRELEWCAQHKVSVIFSADANFGIFAHDVDIARRIVELKQQYGYPKVFESSYAKNTVKHLREIIEILAAGDVLSTGTLSLQSVDPATLDAIRRSNIKVEKYDDLAVEFAKQGLPLVIELMMGLPGSTLESFLGDLQQCIDREVKARVNPTEVLMNSPMNDPEYRREHQIATLRPVNQDWSEDNRTRKKALVVATSSFSRDDYDAMERYRVAFVLCENFALLRQLSRFVRQETGVREMDFYVQLVEEARADPQRWPAIAYVFDVVVELMIPPASWRLFIDEVRTFCTTRLGVTDQQALDTVLRVQLALIPALDRSYPEQVVLDHDFAAWHAAVLEAKREGSSTDWTSAVPRLREFGPGLFAVDDPQAVSELGLGMSLLYDGDSDWELASPVARPMRFRHTVNT